MIGEWSIGEVCISDSLLSATTTTGDPIQLYYAVPGPIAVTYRVPGALALNYAVPAPIALTYDQDGV